MWLGSRVKLARVLVVEPTSLDRGEGLVIDLLCVAEREVGVLRREDGGGGAREDEPISTVMGLM